MKAPAKRRGSGMYDDVGRFLTPEIRGQILHAQSVDGLSLLNPIAKRIEAELEGRR